IEIANRLHPHLARACNLSRRLTGLRGIDHGLQEYADRSTDGIFLVDRTARVAYMNDAGEALLAGARGLVQRHGVLRAASEHGTRKLHALISRAAAANGDRSGGTT